MWKLNPMTYVPTIYHTVLFYSLLSTCGPEQSLSSSCLVVIINNDSKSVLTNTFNLILELESEIERKREKRSRSRSRSNRIQ